MQFFWVRAQIYAYVCLVGRLWLLGAIAGPFANDGMRLRWSLQRQSPTATGTSLLRCTTARRDARCSWRAISRQQANRRTVARRSEVITTRRQTHRSETRCHAVTRQDARPQGQPRGGAASVARIPRRAKTHGCAAACLMATTCAGSLRRGEALDAHGGCLELGGAGLRIGGVDSELVGLHFVGEVEGHEHQPRPQRGINVDGRLYRAAP